MSVNQSNDSLIAVDRNEPGAPDTGDDKLIDLVAIKVHDLQTPFVSS